MSLPTDQIYFWQFIAFTANDKQIIVSLKNMNKRQLKTLKSVTHQILKGDINLSKSEYKQLYEYRNVIRRIAGKTATLSFIAKNFKLIKKIIIIYFNNYEKMQKMV